MRAPDESVTGDEKLFRSARPEDCTGDRVMRLDPQEHDADGVSVRRASFIRTLDDVFKFRDSLETAIVFTTPIVVDGQNPIEPKAGETWQPWHLRVDDLPIVEDKAKGDEEDIAHAEVRPHRRGSPLGSEFVRPKSAARKSIRRAIITAFRVFADDPTTLVLGTRLTPGEAPADGRGSVLKPPGAPR